MILAIIVGCEIGFWVLILLGLCARYVVRLRRTGLVLLAMTPVVDVVLLTATAADLMAGATATVFHGIAAIYLGFSIAYGHKMISWADSRFAYRFADGPAPVKRYARAYTAECWKDVARTALAVLIAAGTLWTLTLVVDDLEKTQALTDLYRILAVIVGAEVLWAIGYFVWPRSQPARAQPSDLRSGPVSGPTT
ncbi:MULTISPECIES: hypothetical protein [Cryobacterium]|uniref:Integral membrane protein n=1 Tax=Cryobacterium breve TaxID=1259258 RepID=A0ABY2IX93_9MICO|nr:MULTISPECIES: hypothetical protein [Cryobacterium]TFC97073.1 hypothetical protein E3T20_03585 [Cryobacterium sp. TmT3-12]TFC97131.1 hypothetical protein E3O65_09920 [Cryobacterium breve]